MAWQSTWYTTSIPEDLIEILERDATETFDGQMGDSILHGNALDIDKRNSQNAWIPTTHWIGGFLWHYISRANRENFLYDIRNIDGESIQFTKYSEGHFYGWHNDAGLSTQYKPVNAGNRINNEEIVTDFINENCELVRKLSVVVQLSDPDDYEGGNLQIMAEDGTSYIVPRRRGTVIVFDSRSQHRVLKVTKGCRKSLVAWVCGKRWS